VNPDITPIEPRQDAAAEIERLTRERDDAAESYLFLMRVIEAIEEGDIELGHGDGDDEDDDGGRWIGWRNGRGLRFETAGQAYHHFMGLDTIGGEA
jgi:hypothetical protein